MRQPIAAEIPHDLQDADEALHRYGRWAMHRHRKQRCASAEGHYRIPPNDDNRQPREILLADFDAMTVQRAIARVPELERLVLTVLYIPQRLPPQAQLRILRIPPRLSVERHARGLRIFDNIHRALVHSRPPDAGQRSGSLPG
jgi:hypothetical protein